MFNNNNGFWHIIRMIIGFIRRIIYAIFNIKIDITTPSTDDDDQQYDY